VLGLAHRVAEAAVLIRDESFGFAAELERAVERLALAGDARCYRLECRLLLVRTFVSLVGFPPVAALHLHPCFSGRRGSRHARGWRTVTGRERRGFTPRTARTRIPERTVR